MIDELHKTPLHAVHVGLGAKMVPFAGYDMPVQYGLGVLKEHLHTRAACGLFDVSHMGQVVLRAKSGDNADACLALEQLVPIDVVDLVTGRQRYGFFTDDHGGILDDLMVGNRGDHLFMVVNASRKQDDFAHLAAGLGQTCHITPLDDRALIALQGPAAAEVLGKICPAVTTMRFMDVWSGEVMGETVVISRSGYSGEDGFEISMPADSAEKIVLRLIEDAKCEPVGLGARDSLRLEAGLCLYGNDIDTATSPVEAGLEWAIQKPRRSGGARAGGFPGTTRILGELAHGTSRRRVGLKPEGKAPVRGHAALYADEAGSRQIGEVTSGGFGPTVDGPVAMGYVPIALAKPGTRLFADVRGKLLPITVAALPFVSPGYKR